MHGCLNTQWVEGSAMLMLSHGIVSPALCFLVGILYDCHKTRISAHIMTAHVMQCHTDMLT